MTGCGCPQSKLVNNAVSSATTIATGSTGAGIIVGEVAEAVACKSNGFLTPVFATIGFAITYVAAYIGNAIFYNTTPKKTLQVCDKSLGLLVNDFDYRLNIHYERAKNLTYIQARTQEKFVALPGKSNFEPDDIDLIECKPFTMSENTPKLNVINDPTVTKIEGTDGDDLIIAPQTATGKEIAIFAINGLNHMIAGPDPVIFLFSLCSTDIINEKVGVIRGNGLIAFTCTRTPIHKDMINIFYDQFEGLDFTFVQACGKEKCSAIAIEGYRNITADDIILNVPWTKISAADFSFADLVNG